MQYIAYDITFWPFNFDQDFTPRNSLFGAVKLTKNVKYSYSW